MYSFDETMSDDISTEGDIRFDQTKSDIPTDEELCKCLRVIGDLEAVKWLLWPRDYRPSPGFLKYGDWTKDPHIWLHYVESTDGALPLDDALISTDSRYWCIHDVQRYFTGELHCEKILFTYQYPNLRMPSKLGSHLWKTNTSTKRQTETYMKEFKRSLAMTLKRVEMSQVQMNRLIVCDQLISINRLDYFQRKTFFRLLMNIMSFQDELQLVSLENLCCTRLEGVRLIQQLACFNAHTLKYLFLWRFVLPNENPLLINYSYITGSGQYIPRPPTQECFLRGLGELRNLRILALEYSHIADGSGAALLSLLPAIRRPHFRLQLMCREDQIPGRADGCSGVGGYGIPDTAWKCVAMACPDLYVLMAFYRIRDYDNVRRFLTPYIPLRETHLQYGIDLKLRQRQDSDITCFVRHIAYQYADTLATFSMHQWRIATFPLRRVLELMPRLVRFFYVGRVADEVDLLKMLRMVACGGFCKIKQINIQVQDEIDRRDYWSKVVQAVTEEFAEIMKLLDINFCLSIYKS